MFNIEKICKENSDKVYRYVFCLTHDKELSEDITQETFYIAIKNIKKFRNECPENIWLCKIAKNLWYQEVNKRKKYETINDDFLNMPNEFKYDDIDDLIIKKNEKRILYQAINMLDDTTKQIIFLRIIGEFSFKEIGALLDSSEVWARVNFYRGKEKLKKILRKENINEN